MLHVRAICPCLSLMRMPIKSLVSKGLVLNTCLRPGCWILGCFWGLFSTFPSLDVWFWKVMPGFAIVSFKTFSAHPLLMNFFMKSICSSLNSRLFGNSNRFWVKTVVNQHRFCCWGDPSSLLSMGDELHDDCCQSDEYRFQQCSRIFDLPWKVLVFLSLYARESQVWTCVWQ